jgi:hypothetical protein
MVRFLKTLTRVTTKTENTDQGYEKKIKTLTRVMKNK